jgi:hypothetical protein
MRIGYAVHGRRSSTFVSASPLGWLFMLPVMLLGWTFQASIRTFIWTVKALVWVYAVPFRLAWQGYQAAQKRRRAAARTAF